MTELQVFNYQGSEVRTVEIDGEPWWVLGDVCKILEISDVHRLASRLDEDERSQTPVTDPLGRLQKTFIVNESGLYNTIMRSDKPEAKKFKRWVTHEVLPTIRKHGMYVTESLLDDPDLAVKVFTALKEERTQRIALQNKVEADKPKVLFAEVVETSKSAVTVGQLAKVLRQNGVDIGRNRFFKWLRANGYVIQQKGADWNTPTQKSVDQGLIEADIRVEQIRETNIVRCRTRITGKGQQHIINKFLNK